MLLKEEAYLGKCQSGIRTSTKHKKKNHCTTNMEYKTALQSNNWCMFLIIVTSSYSA